MLVLIVVSIVGVLFAWLSVHSVRECRKFSEARAAIDWKRLRGTVVAYTVIAGVLAMIVILLNSFVIKDAVVEREWATGEDLTV